MRRLIAPLGFIGLLSLAPLASAMTAPLSEEQLIEAADLIAHGHISDVLCQGEPVYDGQSTTTAYHAILSIGEVTKPEDSDLTSVTLPFATVVWDEDQPPAMCGWTPSYQIGERGLYYLTTGADTELYTLVSWNAFVADAESAGEALPSCEEPEPEPDATTSEDVSESTEDTSEVGPEDDAGPNEPPAADATMGMQCEPGEACDMCGFCSDTGQCNNPPSCPICTSDSDCSEGQTCSWIDSVTSECVSADGTDPGSDGGSDAGGSSDNGGCATGSSGGPLSALFALLALTAYTWRRRALTVSVSR